MSAISLLADIVILNLLFVVSCLPVVTVGAALRAANVVTRDMLAGVGSHRALQYLRELTKAWKPATAFWLLLLGASALLGYQQWVVAQAGVAGAARTVIQGLTLAASFMLAGITVWFYGWAGSAAKQDAPFSELASAAVTCTFRNLPRSFGAVALVGVAVAAVGFTPLQWAIPLVFIIVPALTIYLVRMVLAGAVGDSLGA